MTKKEIKKFIENSLKNKRGKIEGQRLKEKWFKKHGFQEELNFFIKNNLLSTQELFKYLNDEDGICECGRPKRFKGFNEGYQEYCESCGRSKKNIMKTSGYIHAELNEIINIIKDKNNGYSSTKIKKLSDETMQKVFKRTSYLKDCPISERLYHIEHNLYELPKCKQCGKPNNNFRTSKSGYFPYCKNNCSYNYNKEDRRRSLKKYFYEKQFNKFQIGTEYNVKMFSLEDYLNDKDCIVKFKHLKCGHEYEVDIKYQGHYKCPKCFPIRSKQQYFIYDWLKQYTKCRFNDRKFIDPLEIDILTEKFGIEYDGIMYHSTGKSTTERFDNINENPNWHLYKTDLVESKGIQLFRIFSNEWLTHENIWKSMIISKLGKTKKIFARKCDIREIDNKTAKEFMVKNHIQGHINSKIKIGLFYKDELVSVMTLGKTRRVKWNGNDHYELLRFCSKLNTTIIGGASKLLKYFENKYKPKLIVSYANRRWSQGNVYDKLGFNFIENTKPNYFYFKPSDSSKLLSREQFQKHKLKNKLELFDPDLTETENMYNNGYRKIYDCGNKVFIKKYN